MLVDSEKRAAKRAAAGQKTSPYHGVGWDKQKQVWVAELSLGFLDVHARRVGQFACEEEVSRISFGLSFSNTSEMKHDRLPRQARGKHGKPGNVPPSQAAKQYDQAVRSLVGHDAHGKCTAGGILQDQRKRKR